MSGKHLFLTDEERVEVLSLALSGEVLNKDIAAKMGKKAPAITYLLKQHGIKNAAFRKVMGKWNCKHAHLREAVMEYFLTHSAEETAEEFKLTKSEFKSLMTVSYRLPEFKHLRKETRRHDAWTAYEYRFLLQHAGIMPRDWIAKKLKRGGVEAIRGRLDKLGIASKSVNGLTLSQFREAFSREPEYYIKTKAGPGRGNCPESHFKIIPWVWLDQEIKARRLKTIPMFVKLISSMAMFQQWAFEGNAREDLEKIARKRIA